MPRLATITIDIDPTIELGPLELAWHGLMIAVGIAVGGWAAARYARERELDPERLLNAIVVLAFAGIVGSRLFFLAVDDPGALVNPGDWLGTRGFAFYGAIIFGTAAVAVYLRTAGMGARYLDAMAAGFPLGMAVGRIGDLINGEHYGPPTDAPWGIRYTHPEADVPSADVAFHSGGLYEIVLALAMLAIVWPLRHRFRRPTTLLWAVIGLYGAGRFVMFFYRSDTDAGVLGLNEAQLVSLGLVAVAAAGVLWAMRRFPVAGNGRSEAGRPMDARAAS